MEVGGQRSEIGGQKRGLAPRYDPPKADNEIGKIAVDAAIAVHRVLGPGLLVLN